MSNQTKEQVYDEQVFPLMERVIAICKEHKINMAATFSLGLDADGDPLMCSTVLPIDEEDEAGRRICGNARRVFYGEGTLTAFTITTRPANEH